MKNTIIRCLLGAALITSVHAQDITAFSITPCKIQVKTTSVDLSHDAQIVRFNYKQAQKECSVGLESNADWLFTELSDNNLTVNIDENTETTSRIGIIRIGSEPPLTLRITQSASPYKKETAPSLTPRTTASEPNAQAPLSTP